MRELQSIFLGLVFVVSSGDAFFTAVPSRISHSRLLLAEDFDDFSSVGDTGDAPDAEGEALAKAFYQQVRERKTEQEQEEKKSEPRTLSEEEARSLNRKPFGRRQEVIAGKDAGTTPSPRTKRKYTGQTTSGSDIPSAGLFSGKGASVYSVPSASPRERMMRNELDLVGRAEKSLLIQIATTLGLLSLGIYIGLTGGIDANDWSSVSDSLDTSIEGIEGVIPVPTDTEASVWL